MKLQLQVGEETRQVVSGIAEHYSAEELVGKDLILVANLKPVKLVAIYPRDDPGSIRQGRQTVPGDNGQADRIRVFHNLR